MSAWRRSWTAFFWLGLAVTPAAAQYAPQPYNPPATAPYAVQPRPYAPLPAQPQAAPAPAVTYGSESQTLASALSAARSRDLSGARTRQAALTDPVARKLVDWALVDVFGEQLGVSELERIVPQLKGWPREDGRDSAFMRARTGYVTPSGPIPYTSLRPSSLEDAASETFNSRRRAMNDAIRNGDISGAYLAIAHHGLTPGGSEYAEAESFAGWLALNKLRNPTLAGQHFARLDAAVKSPVSKARAAYWRGRAAEAAGDTAGAQTFYARGAEHTTTFYGLLSAERAGQTHLTLTADPVLTQADREAVANSELGRAIRLLSQAGERNLVRVFGLHLGDTVGDRTTLAASVDMIRGLGEQELSLLAYRRGAQRGLILHERGYPLRETPRVMGAPEPAFVLAITRQESQFDPRVRSSADARGMMQLLPSTAAATARKIGLSYDEGRLWEADYNMQLGSAYLGSVAERFGGSYIMAAAGYNAGPGRPASWIDFCSDPRASSSDPLDFIECIPFTETRNYVMRVMENMTVYRARLAGGRAPLTLSKDLKRGSYGYAVATQPAGS